MAAATVEDDRDRRTSGLRARGPGINDNGSGTATSLETAIQIDKLALEPRRALRFAFWGAEEEDLHKALGEMGDGVAHAAWTLAKSRTGLFEDDSLRARNAEAIQTSPVLSRSADRPPRGSSDRYAFAVISGTMS